MFLVQVWRQLYDKVKLAVIAAGLALVGTLLDILGAFDWTSAIGGPLGTFVALVVLALGQFVRKEVTGHILEAQKNTESVVPLASNPDDAPPVG